ncbi:DUF1146 family protein [Pullulanibacillus pueri]|uniref:Putative membrane protein YwzB n=1 Tax=Pullulanibacillus pueri TaxID=1437324 RepID=A0A8J2ZX62_9BACL|nr:DUF1146 family protein [Pullulanibacillus pueri]GGH84098.1 putative membrane protein YwzB [Pullulanibacillus pueri]
MNFGAQALLYLVIHIGALILTWWAIQSLNLEFLLKNPKGIRARAFLILLSIAISYLVADFFLDYFSQSLYLPQIYK